MSVDKLRSKIHHVKYMERLIDCLKSGAHNEIHSSILNTVLLLKVH